MPAPAFAVADHLAVDGETPAVHFFQMVYATQESGLARPRRPDYAHDRAFADLEVDALQDFHAPVAFSHAFGLDH
jgi:hypothetical protein